MRTAAGQPQGDVLNHRTPGQQASFLVHDPHLIAKGVTRLAVEADGTAGERVEAGQLTQQRALAAAAATNDGDELAGRDAQVEAMQNLPLAKALDQPADLHGQAAAATLNSFDLRQFEIVDLHHRSFHQAAL